MSVSWPACWDHIFQRLQKLRQVDATSWECLCPAHEDRRPSLTLRVGGNGGLLVKCQRNAGKGCTSDEIMRAIDCTLEDLWPDNKRYTGGVFKTDEALGRKREATYDYRNPDGSLAFQVLRFRNADGTKQFQQRHFKDGQWVWNINGVRRILYRLPEFTAYHREHLGREDGVVFVVEGEKAADKLWDIGLAATTASGGAGKFALTDHSPLAGMHVVVLPDNDPYDEKYKGWIGQDHAEEVCRLVHPAAASVRYADLPGLPPKGDAFDWIDARLRAGVIVDEVRRELLTVVGAETPWVMPDHPHPLLAAMEDAEVRGRWASSREWLQELQEAVDDMCENASGDDADMIHRAGEVVAILGSGMRTYHGLVRKKRSRPGGPSGKTA